MKEYKDKILKFYRENKRMPVYEEVMRLLGFKSKNSVYKLINKLVKEGIFEKDSRGHIIPCKLQSEIPFLGLVEAGIPSVAEADLSETLDVGEYLIPKSSNTYLLEVKGDSMIEAGIHEGDLVIAESLREPKEGDIVIAEVDGGWTMKYLRKKGNKVYLEPANRKYKPIYPEEDLKISAVVKGVIRKY